MKLFKRLSAISVAVAIAATFATNVSAANRTAYSVGVSYYESASDTSADNFVTNATNAANAYARISGISSARTQYPTTTSLKNHINDNVIFYNSHANYDHIAFKYKNSSGVFTQVGVHMNGDGTGVSGTKYVGLSGRSLSNVELITFAGCYTALTDNGNNITATAVARGAKCAVGFTGKIESRVPAGIAWLKSYNDYLASGSLVGQAVYDATRNNSSSNLGKLVSIYGYGADKITSTSAKAIAFSDGTNNIVAAEKVLSSEKALFDFMHSYDNEFDENEYKYYVNMFAKESNTGMIVFNHYINDNIITNKSYTIYIENGYVADVSKNNFGKFVDENMLDEQAIAFSNRPEVMAYSENNTNIDEINEYYEYDYNTGELRYIKVEFYTNESGEIVENSTVIVIGE